MTDVVRVLLSVLLVLVVLLAVRRRSPVLFWWLVGYPLVALRVRASYRATMDACGLTVPASPVRRATARMVGRQAAPVPPRRSLPRPTGSGLVMRLRMAAGQAPEDFTASADRLRHAWGAHAVYVRPTKPGWLELRLVGWDVLAEVRPFRRRLAAGPLRLPLALREDGEWHVRDFRTVPHELILGATQSGKSVYLRNLLCGLARQPVVLVGIDCKWGVELAPFAPRLSALADTPDRADGLLDALLEEMEARFRLIGLSSGAGPDAVLTSDVWGLPEAVRPVPVVLVVDEVAELFLAANKDDEKRRDAMVTKLIRLAQLGRAAGIYLEVCGQRFGSELGKGATMLRAQLTGRVCHRVNDETSATMALGDIAPEAVLAATAIPAERPGVAVVGDSSGGWSRVRSPHLSLDDAAAVCRDTSALVPELPRLDPFRPAVAIEPAGSFSAPAVPLTHPVTE
ncbi:FtsK/SpoIIIE domain-containing protein [Streptomyces somaliensis DSM 40738]|uniref:Conjugal transfer protein TraS n=1 Tax=Streptomyces somaliensis (strain ATCC 33201 / DSM 40738 / JCM 12659 / KCTC 9044 / NCTC 11332 / NRRL B-12077 / IP 733) TaxID=1134445 RepID=A0AA44DB77_STRE0|nr:FtsK/SpoIIIE domain-containing protein [Streptomyces somaliensis]MCQ0023148.1 FtsK/SpoIIIE domain-containing protein [Streptomyces somaliensis DSM 40738]NKY13248.1 conjugal transfer protein TraS [Streptomyces somaliensis DSM 40738]